MIEKLVFHDDVIYTAVDVGEKINELVEVSNIHTEALRVLSRTLNAMSVLIDSNTKIVDKLTMLHKDELMLEIYQKEKTDD